ncbi:MAG: ribosome small subunit-dependent GTPase A [Bdellovibrionales bacterium]|nr:ribosome small subunit-dependent GTPase A [Bdellovibrionales bacterium]
MINSNKEFLSLFGWDDFFQSQVLTLSSESLFIGRVINEEKHLYRVQFGIDENISASVTGKMQFEAMGRVDYPAVGDWVLIHKTSNNERATIRHILKRKTVLQRKKVGEVSEIQILATNIDYVFITTSMNDDLNLGRLERYLTFALDSKAIPVLILTKADLCPDVEGAVSEVKERFPEVKVHAISVNNFSETAFFQDYLIEGKTAVIVGSSGVGKSTLGNYLIGENVIVTQVIRFDDDKGKHTTTARSMYKSFYGGLIVDTPGMRELQFSSHEEGMDNLFSDIEELKTRCRFSNCKHETEDDCAILEALENGQLLPARWKSYNKIQREVRHEMRKHNKWIMAEDRKVWKKRMVSNRQKFKGQH